MAVSEGCGGAACGLLRPCGPAVLALPLAACSGMLIVAYSSITLIEPAHALT